MSLGSHNDQGSYICFHPQLLCNSPSISGKVVPVGKSQNGHGDLQCVRRCPWFVLRFIIPTLQVATICFRMTSRFTNNYMFRFWHFRKDSCCWESWHVMHPSKMLELWISTFGISFQRLGGKPLFNLSSVLTWALLGLPLPSPLQWRPGQTREVQHQQSQELWLHTLGQGSSCAQSDPHLRRAAQFRRKKKKKIRMAKQPPLVNR